MAARATLMVLLALLLAACNDVAQIIVVKSDPAGTPVIIPELIIIEPQAVPPFVPDFSATLVVVTQDVPFPTSQPTITQVPPVMTQTPLPETTPGNLPPHMGGNG